MKELRTEISIAAPVERIWQILTDFGSYPDWNPFIKTVEGQPNPGSTLRVQIEPPGGRRMKFQPKVLRAEPPRELRWLGRLLVPGVFDGEHSFELEALSDETSRFVQRERFSGLLVPLFGATLRKTEAGFRAMNEALKERASATVVGATNDVGDDAGTRSTQLAQE